MKFNIKIPILMEENAQQNLTSRLRSAHEDLASKRSIKKWPQKQSKQMSINALPSSVKDSQGSLCSRIGRRVSRSWTPLLLDLGLHNYIGYDHSMRVWLFFSSVTT